MMESTEQKTRFSDLPFYKLKWQVDWRLALLGLAFPDLSEPFSLEQALSDKQVGMGIAIERIHSSYGPRIESEVTNDKIGSCILLRPCRVSDSATGKTIGHGLLSLFAHEILEEVTKLFDKALTLDVLSVLDAWTVRKIVSDVVGKRSFNKEFLKGEQLEDTVKMVATLLLYQGDPEPGWSSYDQDKFFEALEGQSRRVWKCSLPMKELKLLPVWEQEQGYLELWYEQFPTWGNREHRKALVEVAKEEYRRRQPLYQYKNRTDWKQEIENVNRPWVEDAKTRIRQNIEAETNLSLWEIAYVDQPVEMGGPPPFALRDLWQEVIHDPKAFLTEKPNQVAKLASPQLLHLRTIKELRVMSLNRRWQAEFEWMIEPILEIESQKGNFYPFPIGQTEDEAAQMVESFRESMRENWKLKSNRWPLWAEMDWLNSAIQDSYTSERQIQQDRITKSNVECIRARLEAAKPGSEYENLSLAELQGSFGAEPIQEFCQRQEVVWHLLNDPPSFFGESTTSQTFILDTSSNTEHPKTTESQKKTPFIRLNDSIPYQSFVEVNGKRLYTKLDTQEESILIHLIQERGKSTFSKISGQYEIDDGQIKKSIENINQKYRGEPILGSGALVQYYREKITLVANIIDPQKTLNTTKNP